MRGIKSLPWALGLGLLWAVSAPALAGSPLGLVGIEAPATEGTADSYPGAVAVRSFVDGFVVAVSGAWGSATLLVDAAEPVPEWAASDPRGKVLVEGGELVVVLPASGQALRLRLPTPESGAPAVLAADQLDQLHARQGTVDLVEVEGRHIVSFVPALAGLTAEELLSTEELGAVVAARLSPPAVGLEVLAAGAFNQTPPDDGGGGCSSSCAVSCPPTNNSCTATGGGTSSCCTCRCNQGSASCSCR